MLWKRRSIKRAFWSRGYRLLADKTMLHLFKTITLQQTPSNNSWHMHYQDSVIPLSRPCCPYSIHGAMAMCKNTAKIQNGRISKVRVATCQPRVTRQTLGNSQASTKAISYCFFFRCQRLNTAVDLFEMFVRMLQLDVCFSPISSPENIQKGLSEVPNGRRLKTLLMSCLECDSPIE